MHPNAFLKTFWQLDVKPQIFVAMSFSDEYRKRYELVIAPVISSLKFNGTPLVPYRVDSSKSGDFILTDIVDGIAHSQMILADVSSIGRDSKTGTPYRNGNVMYEVGIALACRLPSDVLLIRDDKDKFLFDVSTVPHMYLDFTNIKEASFSLNSELQMRLKEQSYLNDARVNLAIASLSNIEIELISQFADLPEGTARGWLSGGVRVAFMEAAIMHLLDKRLIVLTGRFEKGYAGYQPTQLGRIVSKIVKSDLRKLQSTGDEVGPSEFGIGSITEKR
jgi:hypothetical protein